VAIVQIIAINFDLWQTLKCHTRFNIHPEVMNPFRGYIKDHTQDNRQ